MYQWLFINRDKCTTEEDVKNRGNCVWKRVYGYFISYHFLLYSLFQPHWPSVMFWTIYLASESLHLLFTKPGTSSPQTVPLFLLPILQVCPQLLLPSVTFPVLSIISASNFSFPITLLFLACIFFIALNTSSPWSYFNLYTFFLIKI